MSKRSVTVAAVDVEALEREAHGAIAAASTRAALDDARVHYLGRKSELKQALRGVRDRESGLSLNAARERLEAAFDARQDELDRAELAQLDEALDVTLPGTPLRRGRLHPLTQIIREIEDIFLGLGYEVVDSREVETVWHNFDALNQPLTHPSRSHRDTFYVDEALAAGGPVVELGVGTGRIAIPTAAAGVHVIGVDSSRGMLDVCAEQAEAAGLAHLLDLRLGDLLDPPVQERVPLVTCPFRAYLHLASDVERRGALRAARDVLLPGGRLVFDVFAPAPDDVAETHARWLEREPGIFERADWDTSRRTLTLSVRDDARSSTMTLSWLSPREWRRLLEAAGLEVVACYGWFDRRPYAGGEDTIWIARRPAGGVTPSATCASPSRPGR